MNWYNFFLVIRVWSPRAFTFLTISDVKIQFLLSAIVKSKSLGCSNTSQKLFHRAYFSLDPGITIWTKRSVQANEPTPNSHDKWWLRTFLNHETLGFYFGCKSNQPAIKDMAERNNRKRAHYNENRIISKL